MKDDPKKQMGKSLGTYWVVVKPDGSFASPYQMAMPALYRSLGQARRRRNEGKVVQVSLTVTGWDKDSDA